MALLETAMIESALRDAESQYKTARPDWTKLAPTSDRGRFFERDALTESLTPSKGPLVGGLSSRNVKDRRLTANAKLGGGCKSRIGGVSGGYVENAKGDRTIDRAAHKATVSQKRKQKSAKRAANREYKRMLIAELQSRGYNVG